MKRHVWIVALCSALVTTRTLAQESIAVSEADQAYVARFLESYKQSDPVPDLQDYATIERYDKTFLGDNLDKALADVQNDDGGMAWGLSYRMMSLNTMYAVTRDAKYLEANLRCVLAAAAATDDKRDKKLWTGAVAPIWGCDKYSGRGRAAFAVHTGIISWPMLEFLRLSKDAPDLVSATDREAIQATVLLAIAYHDRQWRDGPTAGEGHYIGMEQEPICEGKPLPGNRLNAMAHALWQSWLLTGNETHRDRAIAIAHYFKNRLALASDGGYYWPYWLPADPVAGPAEREAIDGEDTSHAGLTASIVAPLFAGNVVFNEEDLDRFGRTVINGFARLNNGVLFGAITGDSKSNPSYIGIPANWLHLARRNPEVGERIVAYYLNYVKNPGPLDLSLLINLASDGVPSGE